MLMIEEGDPGLTNLFNQALERLLEERGFHLPLYATMIGSNGVMVMSRYDAVGDPRARAQIVAEYEPADVMTWPVHGLIVDTGGQGAHLVFPSPGVMEFRE
jgi:hypothetical protein